MLLQGSLEPSQYFKITKMSHLNSHKYCKIPKIQFRSDIIPGGVNQAFLRYAKVSKKNVSVFEILKITKNVK